MPRHRPGLGGANGRIHRRAAQFAAAGITLMIAGLALRWTAIVLLGQSFTVDAATSGQLF